VKFWLTNKVFFKSISGKTALLILSAIITVHFIVMYLYVQDTRLAQRTATRDELIQKIINTIHLVQATPVLNRSHAVEAIEDPDVHVTVSATPSWKLRFKEISFWDISHALRHNLDSFAISIKLMKNQWLNINAAIYSHILLTQLLLISLEFFVFGAILFAAWSISRFTKPLKNFKTAADRLGVDLNTKPLAVYGPAVVTDTANAMNKMQERIKDLIRDRTQMLAAISHDLRTPITRIKLRAQFITDEEIYAKLINDLDEMESMIAQTLSFAREDAVKEQETTLDLVALLFSICGEMLDMQHDVTFNCTVHQIIVKGRRLGLKRAFTNLINNGIRYGNRVDIHISAQNKKALILFEDEGPGIPKEELANVFAPFYRSDTSRSRDTGGVGLGLAVTRDIVRTHHGTITLKNRPEGGLQVSIALPADEVM
jgi:signal transduction histidine kinase